MALIRQYNEYFCGGFFSFTYSPLYPEKLDMFDRSPCLLWINMNNGRRADGKPMNLFSGINFHWLTVKQREKLIGYLFKYYKNNKNYNDFRVDEKIPLNLTWDIIKSWDTSFGIAWRRYFPNRVRNLKWLAPTWDYIEVNRDVIHTDTVRIIGVTPEFIQRQAIMNQQKKLWNQRQLQNKKLAMMQQAKMRRNTLNKT